MSRSLVVVGSLIPAALLVVPPAYGFEATWTDQFDETSYSITGPDVVSIDETFEIVITASDPLYPDNMVASPWSFLEDDVEIDSSFAVFLTDTSWERTYSYTYTSPGSHTYTFTAQDLGHGGGAHSWEWFEIAGTTVVEGIVDVPGDVSVVSELRIQPNPTRSDVVFRSTTPGSDGGTVQLFDSSGRLIRSLAGSVGEGSRGREWHWDGTDRYGASVVPGVYVYVMHGSDGRRSGKVVVLR